MKLKRLGLKNYRNCESVELDFPALKTLIIGKNAQGKTNILESIYFLSDLKSPRTSTISGLDLINRNLRLMQKLTKMIPILNWIIFIHKIKSVS